MFIAERKGADLANDIRWLLTHRRGGRASKSTCLQDIRGRCAEPELPSRIRWRLGAYFINYEMDALLQQHGIRIEKHYKGVCLERTYYAV